MNDNSTGKSIKQMCSVPDPTFTDVPWYRSWVWHQVQSQPPRLLLALPEKDKLEWEVFLPLWNKVREKLLAHNNSTTVDSITDELIKDGLLSLDGNDDTYLSAKELIFSVLGWQTMLYMPDISSYPTREFHLLDETNGYRGEGRLCMNQPCTSGRNDIPSFLLGFGMMLPPRDYCAFEDMDERTLFDDMKVVVTTALNASVLTKVCGIRLQWVDSLSCHLDFNVHSGILFLYRYPSFCEYVLQRQNTQDQVKSPIHCCGFERAGSIPWGSDKDVTELLREILLSYRLLFGQSRQSRRAFRHLKPFEGKVNEARDRFLTEICGRKHPNCSIQLIERDEYSLAGDFPHLRSKLVRLSDYAAKKQPRSIAEIWRDKRDSPAWLVFWSVLFFGSVGVILAVTQTAFQIVQSVSAIREGV